MVPSGCRNWLIITLVCLHIPFLLVQARFHHPRTMHNTISKRDALSDSGLATASWIWASGATSGNVAFLKTFSSATGKFAASATISITAVNQFTIWVNGQPIGASSDWTSAQVFSAALNTSSNTFSVLAGNSANAGAPPPGLLAAIKVQYSDGSADTVVSDSNWQASANIPSDFPLPSDTSHFASAAVASKFGSGAWGTSLAMPSPDPNAPSLSGGTWIWSTSDAEYAAAAGTVGFRKTVTTPNGKSAQSATILLTADNTFTLYVNGKYVGAPPYQADATVESTAWGRAQQFTVGLNAATNTFTVIVQNFLNPTTGATSPGGLVAAIRVVYADGSSDLVRTDPSWLSGPFTGASAFLALPDASLAGSFNVAAVGAWPWGVLSGVSNVLAAADVPSNPFNGAVAASNGGGTTSGGGAAAGAPGGGTSVAGVTTSAHVTTAVPAGASPSGSGVSPGPPAASTVRLGSGVDTSIAAGSATNTGAGFGSGSGTASLSSPTGNTDFPSTSTHARGVPIAAIVGGVVGGLALIVIPLAILRWRRRRQTLQRHSSRSSITPFAAGDNNGHSASSRTSLVSARRAEMSELQPQRLGHMNCALPSPAGAAQEAPRAESPPPQRVVPPTKLEREHMMRSTTAASSSGASDSSPASRTVTDSPSANASGAGVHATAPFPPPETEYGDSNPDTDTLPPPSYYAE
ncbi:hypothetical protein DFH09DRAFT_1292561 [Mycena vulgaris]|nr:hypothetical protein DFH09DRAFT_1292561 [Mycena vulgaris]